MKKDVPLAVLKFIEPILAQLDQAQLIVHRDSGFIFKVSDAEIGSDFYYQLFDAAAISAGGNTVTVNHKPASVSNIGANEYKINASQIAVNFKNWLDIIQGYQKVKTIFDDPILKQYAEDFYTAFESADEDANTVSFNLKQQLLLDSALSQVVEVLKEQETEANKEAIAEIIEEVVEVQSTVTENTKQETLTKLSKIFAKIQKVGIKVIKHVAPIIEKEIIGAIIKSGVTVAGAAATVHLLNP
jgi:hypothetical protein